MITPDCSEAGNLVAASHQSAADSRFSKGAAGWPNFSPTRQSSPLPYFRERVLPFVLASRRPCVSGLGLKLGLGLGLGCGPLAALAGVRVEGCFSLGLYAGCGCFRLAFLVLCFVLVFLWLFLKKRLLLINILYSELLLYFSLGHLFLYILFEYILPLLKPVKP